MCGPVDIGKEDAIKLLQLCVNEVSFQLQSFLVLIAQFG